MAPNSKALHVDFEADLRRLVSALPCDEVWGWVGRPTMMEVKRAKPQSVWITEGDRPPDYGVRRIRFFIELISAGKPLDPIVVVATEGEPQLNMVRGHHRLAAAFLSKQSTINCRLEGDTSRTVELR